jgi:hypothetical protein
MGRHRPVSPDLECPLLCRFSDAGNDEARHTLGRPASEKRQGTKSREVRHGRCRGLYGDLAAASDWGGWLGGPAPIALPRRMGLGNGLNERHGALPDRVGGATAGRFIDLE